MSASTSAIERLGGQLLKAPRQDSAGAAGSDEVRLRVSGILAAVRQGGLAAVRRLSAELDSWEPDSFRVTPSEIDDAFDRVGTALVERIRFSIDNVVRFAEAQRACLLPLDVQLHPGIWLGHRVLPVGSVGAYVPGGRYPLIASAFMTIATAKVAGVERVVAVAPPQRDGRGINSGQLVAMTLSGADEIYSVGGVQALAALAYGVESFGAPVDMLVGAGNDYVTEAKRQLFGSVGIDALAGPSELVVLADDTADPVTVAADLLGQAEHGPTSEVVLVTHSEALAQAVLAAVPGRLASLVTRDTAAAAWDNRGVVIVTSSRESSVAVVNYLASEHLEVQTADPEWYFERLTAYGTLFLGADATVAYSDKSIGTNHVLPTGRSARYAGGLWVGSYLRVMTHQRVSPGATHEVAAATYAISTAEGMAGHAETARLRHPEVENLSPSLAHFVRE